MPPIGWIDFSSEHRDQVRSLLDSLGTQGVLDELGIGVIRDAFANYFFPGISTIQTRSKYFTLTALLLHDYLREQREGKGARRLEDYLREKELSCRITLIKNSSNPAGVIGVRFGLDRRRDVERRASSVYWNGLRTFGFVRIAGSLGDFERAWFAFQKRKPALLAARGEEVGDDGDAHDADSLTVVVPEVPEDYWDSLSIEMLPAEAELLRDQILLTQEDSLLAHVLRSKEATAQTLALSSATTAEAFPDFTRLPFVEHLPDEHRSALAHARDFWTVTEGAHIRYNCLLAERGYPVGERDELEEDWENWRSRLESVFHRWDDSFFWAFLERQAGNPSRLPRSFVKEWFSMARHGATDSTSCDDLVRRRELAVKGRRARLGTLSQVRTNGFGRIGIGYLDYRFPQFRVLLEDIYNALQNR